MVFGLGKLFGRKEEPESPSPAPTPAGGQESASAFIRRDAVFNRERQPAGHLFRLQHLDAGLGDAPTRRQQALDDALLKSLCSSAREEGWGKNLAFVPLSTVSLNNPWLDRLPPQNTVLLLMLAPETTDAAALSARCAALKNRGLRLGFFRQPKHPAFAAALSLAEFAAIDVAASQGGNVRDFSIAIRSDEVRHPVTLVAVNIEAKDDYQLCRQWHFDYFHGPFITAGESAEPTRGDPHKLHLLHLFNLVQGEAENAEVAALLKQDPLLTFRILRYLNSAAIGLARPVSSIDQALILLGRQRLARWLSVLLFSVKDPDFADWLLVETSLGRGRIMELLGAQRFPAAEADHLFLTGVFSRLDRLLRIPLADAVRQLLLPTHIRNALLERSGPYAPLLAVAEACEGFDPPRMEAAARAAGLDPDTVNRALLDATAWTSEITQHWE
ncbi:MAG: putative signal transduction protein containing and modified domain [Rhodocyclaceae bacterium]|nr:putative signal transduction protein containing and modified domain [Rhodocyclaceae bacterium]